MHVTMLVTVSRAVWSVPVIVRVSKHTNGCQSQSAVSLSPAAIFQQLKILIYLGLKIETGWTQTVNRHTN